MMTNKVKFNYYLYNGRINLYYRFNTRNNDFEYLFNKSWHSSQYETLGKLLEDSQYVTSGKLLEDIKRAERGTVLSLPSWSFLKPEEVLIEIDKLKMLKELVK